MLPFSMNDVTVFNVIVFPCIVQQIYLILDDAKLAYVSLGYSGHTRSNCSYFLSGTDSITDHTNGTLTDRIRTTWNMIYNKCVRSHVLIDASVQNVLPQLGRVDVAAGGLWRNPLSVKRGCPSSNAGSGWADVGRHFRHRLNSSPDFRMRTAASVTDGREKSRRKKGKTFSVENFKYFSRKLI